MLDELEHGQYVIIGVGLTQKAEGELLAFLRKNKDVFAWSSRHLVGVSRELIKHKLTVSSEVKPKKQRLGKMSDKKVMEILVEVQKLLVSNIKVQ